VGIKYFPARNYYAMGNGGPRSHSLADGFTAEESTVILRQQNLQNGRVERAGETMWPRSSSNHSAPAPVIP